MKPFNECLRWACDDPVRWHKFGYTIGTRIARFFSSSGSSAPQNHH
jgi:hypothetical protein